MWDLRSCVRGVSRGEGSMAAKMMAKDQPVPAKRFSPPSPPRAFASPSPQCVHSNPRSNAPSPTRSRRPAAPRTFRNFLLAGERIESMTSEVRRAAWPSPGPIASASPSPAVACCVFQGFLGVERLGLPPPASRFPAEKSQGASIDLDWRVQGIGGVGYTRRKSNSYWTLHRACILASSSTGFGFRV